MNNILTAIQYGIGAGVGLGIVLAPIVYFIFLYKAHKKYEAYKEQLKKDSWEMWLNRWIKNTKGVGDE